MSVTRLYSSTLVKLNTLLIVFIFILKDKARDYGKGSLHFRRVLAVFSQSQCTGSAGQSEQTVLVGRKDFVENEAFERGRAQRTYNNVQYLKNNVFFLH